MPEMPDTDYPPDTDLESVSPPPAPPAGTPSLTSRIGDVVEILLVALAGSVLAPVLLSVLGLPPHEILRSSAVLCTFLAVEATVTLLLLRGLLWWRGENLANLGWGAGRPWAEVKAGLLTIPILFGATFAVGLTFRLLAPDYVTEVNPMLALVHSWKDLALFWLSSIYVGGLKEEIQRAFVLRRFRHLGGPKVGLVIWSLIFGLGHSVQGFDNAFAAGFLGLIFGILYLRRGSLTGPVVAHALYNILTLTVYWLFVR